jgi:hypothetical protein
MIEAPVMVAELNLNKVGLPGKGAAVSRHGLSRSAGEPDAGGQSGGRKTNSGRNHWQSLFVVSPRGGKDTRTGERPINGTASNRALR